jgi:hypothetical protein
LFSAVEIAVNLGLDDGEDVEARPVVLALELAATQDCCVSDPEYHTERIAEKIKMGRVEEEERKSSKAQSATLSDGPVLVPNKMDKLPRLDSSPRAPE